jgi:hypothetical protein
MKNTRIFSLLLVTIVLMLSSCGMIINSYIRKDTENVPPDFGKGKTTLLVVRERKGYNKKVDEIFQKYYTGDYIFVDREELNTKYSDTINYRYVIDDDISISRSEVTTMTRNSSTGMSTRSNEVRSAASRSFHILDRKTKNIHDTGVSSGTSWKKILKTYLKKLDSERKKNAGK